MSGTYEGYLKSKATRIKRLGSEEAYIKEMKERSAKGGRNGHTGGFATNHELARMLGSKGGRISKRKKRV